VWIVESLKKFIDYCQENGWIRMLKCPNCCIEASNLRKLNLHMLIHQDEKRDEIQMVAFDPNDDYGMSYRMRFGVSYNIVGTVEMLFAQMKIVVIMMLNMMTKSCWSVLFAWKTFRRGIRFIFYLVNTNFMSDNNELKTPLASSDYYGNNDAPKGGKKTKSFGTMDFEIITKSNPQIDEPSLKKSSKNLLVDVEDSSVLPTGCLGNGVTVKTSFFMSFLSFTRFHR
jgi:hypothetical protein